MTYKVDEYRSAWKYYSPLRTVCVESKVYISEHYEHILQVKTPKLSTK